jgi:alkylhydroperoxidase family enzyme
VESAPIPEGLRATLAFLEKLTLSPAELGPGDAEAVFAAGVSREALVTAIQVAALFNMIDRMADALGWDVPPFEAFFERADGMLASGYALE